MSYPSLSWWTNSWSHWKHWDDDVESWRRWRGYETEGEWNLRALEIAEKNWEEEKRSMSTAEWRNWGKKTDSLQLEKKENRIGRHMIFGPRWLSLKHVMCFVETFQK